jgi:hypothetical protein
MCQAGPALGALLSLVSTLAEDIDANRGRNVAVRSILIRAGCFRTIHIMAPLRPRRRQGPCSRNACWRWGTSNLTRSVAVPGNERRSLRTRLAAIAYATNRNGPASP